MPSKLIAFRMPPELHAWFEAWRKDRDLSASAAVLWLIREGRAHHDLPSLEGPVDDIPEAGADWFAKAKRQSPLVTPAPKPQPTQPVHSRLKGQWKAP